MENNIVEVKKGRNIWKLTKEDIKKLLQWLAEGSACCADDLLKEEDWLENLFDELLYDDFVEILGKYPDELSSNLQVNYIDPSYNAQTLIKELWDNTWDEEP